MCVGEISSVSEGLASALPAAQVVPALLPPSLSCRTSKLCSSELPTGLCLSWSLHGAMARGRRSIEELVNLGRGESLGSFQSPSEIAAVLQT